MYSCEIAIKKKKKKKPQGLVICLWFPYVLIELVCPDFTQVYYSCSPADLSVYFGGEPHREAQARQRCQLEGQKIM